MEIVLLGLYTAALSVLFLFGIHSLVMVYYYVRTSRLPSPQAPPLQEFPMVTVQLPIYNEYYVVERLLHAVCAMEYPRDRLEIQVLDDSTDETTELIARLVQHYRAQGIDIVHLRRNSREGYKAGALRYGLERARGEFIAIFDADFVPRPDFLHKTLPYFADPRVGMVQTRWEHLNEDYSLLTRAQALALDGHFALEQTTRNRAGSSSTSTARLVSGAALASKMPATGTRTRSPKISTSATAPSSGDGSSSSSTTSPPRRSCRWTSTRSNRSSTAGQRALSRSPGSCSRSSGAPRFRCASSWKPPCI
jgi:cellulose synthase/poly-beta-1,6-N-acetylglucosamine synthase-like glycosyltransferase